MTAPKDLKPKPARGNYIAEWYGHRVFPVVEASDSALHDQRLGRCPLLSRVLGTETQCKKTSANSKGVCSISSRTNGVRRDWAVCPIRAFDVELFENAARRLFVHNSDDEVLITAAPALDDAEQRASFLTKLQAGARGIVFFHEKAGGEIGVAATTRSPEVSFDVTLVEVLLQNGELSLGRYGVIEIQTMDFHGSYSHATTPLRKILAEAPETFFAHLQEDADRLGYGIETPNVANVFKRTFYQMMFKFQLAAHQHSAGCIFAIPRSVWESWQPFLGAPELVVDNDGEWSLQGVGIEGEQNPPAWIYVFDVEESAEAAPNRLKLWKVIATDAASLSHFALGMAPAAALAEGGSADRILTTLQNKLYKRLPLTVHGQASLFDT